eukprot:674705-Pyramimonas_sp.AAC.1
MEASTMPGEMASAIGLSWTFSDHALEIASGSMLVPVSASCFSFQIASSKMRWTGDRYIVAYFVPMGSRRFVDFQ